MYCVQVVRNPRRVLFSRRKRSTPDDLGRARPIETAKIAVYWMLRQLTFDAIRRRYGKEQSFVVYERLMQDANSALRTACRLLGEHELAGELRPWVPLQVPEVHGPDRSSIQKFKPTQVVLSVDNRWRIELHPFDRVLMTFLTFPLLRRYGYPIRMRGGSRRDK